jgi:nicotinate-nucleotide adenylyltransferase
MGRIGILGGTFNPPHIAHLVCAQEARHQLGLDQVLLVPVNVPPHKVAPDDPGPAHRARMCELAARNQSWLTVSTIEIDREGQSYTVDTLRQLHEDAPRDELVLIVGADAAASLPGWRMPEEIAQLATLAVASRGTVHEGDVREALALVDSGPPAPRIAAPVFFDMPRLDISSTDIRRRVATGRPIRYLVPDPVADYIDRHGLYRVTAGIEAG